MTGNPTTRDAITWERGKQTGQVTLYWVDGVWLTLEMSTDWRAMKTAAAKDGVTLTPTFGFRFPDQQAKLYVERMDQPGDSPEVLKAKVLIRNKLGVAARPGYSLHQSGKALDIRVGLTPEAFKAGKRTRTWEWLDKNAGRFNFATLRVALEPWHLEHEVK